MTLLDHLCRGTNSGSFNYCDIIWSNCGLKSLYNLELLQTQSARILPTYVHKPQVDALSRLLVTHIEYQHSIMVYKSLIASVSHIWGICSSKFILCTKILQNSAHQSYTSVINVDYLSETNHWNTMSKYIRDATTLNQFKAFSLSQIFFMT